MTEMDRFRFEYDPPLVQFGADAVSSLGTELETLGYDSALVVCGRTVGSTPAVIDPVRDGLGDHLAGVVARTTPQKRLTTAIRIATEFEGIGADTLVALGGGSSIDIAKVASVLIASDRPPDELGSQLQTTGTIPVPETRIPPVFAVPTTVAGADISQLAGLTETVDSGLVDRDVSGGLSDPRLMPDGVWYDPELVRTTPQRVLTASAMNGFDKGIETLYARSRTPITDGTAVRGLQLLVDGLPTLAEDPEAWDLETILQGIVLVQYGISRPDGTTLSLIHALGHGVKAHVDVHQGVAHAVLAPHALLYLFESVDGRRTLLADALCVPSDEDPATGAVDAVESVRDALGLPSRFRNVDGVDRSLFDAMAETTVEDSLLGNVPPGLDPHSDDIRAILESAW